MADMLSILIIMIVAYFTVKRLILPRILAIRAAKKGKGKGDGEGETAPTDPRLTGNEGMQTVPTAIPAIPAARPGIRPVTCLDVRFVRFNLPDDEGIEETLTSRIAYAANEMLLNASIRGSDVRFHVAVTHPDLMMLYVTYTVC